MRSCSPERVGYTSRRTVWLSKPASETPEAGPRFSPTCGGCWPVAHAPTQCASAELCSAPAAGSTVRARLAKPAKAMRPPRMAARLSQVDISPVLRLLDEPGQAVDNGQHQF